MDLANKRLFLPRLISQTVRKSICEAERTSCLCSLTIADSLDCIATTSSVCAFSFCRRDMMIAVVSPSSAPVLVSPVALLSAIPADARTASGSMAIDRWIVSARRERSPLHRHSTDNSDSSKSPQTPNQTTAPIPRRPHPRPQATSAPPLRPLCRKRLAGLREIADLRVNGPCERRIGRDLSGSAG